MVGGLGVRISDQGERGLEVRDWRVGGQGSKGGRSQG